MVEFLTDFFSDQFNFSAVFTLVLLGILLSTVGYSTFFERKVSAWIQDREGPNRVGFLGLFKNFHFWGLGQPLADGLKFLLKEDIIPRHVDKPLFIAAPGIALVVSTIGYAIIPWGGQVLIGDSLINVQVANPGVGLLYLLAVGSLGVYGVVLGGWASNNKYSFFGAMRATAQMLSYEIPMGVMIMVVVITCGTLDLNGIVGWQYEHGGIWMLFRHPLAAFILLITIFAETNRAPFDLAESEQELVGGFHTEYSAMKFALFFLGEYMHIIVGSAFFVVLFMGGWDLFPFISIPYFRPEDHSILAGILKFGVTFGKVVLMIFFFMWVRWTLPRFRFDQLMRMAWKGLIPMSIGVLVVAIVGLYFGLHDNILFTLVGNFVVLAVALAVSAFSTAPITGRQANMPAVAPAGKSGKALGSAS